MKKIFKKLIAAAMAGVMAVSGLCVGASANEATTLSIVESGDVGKFEWDIFWCKTTNTTNVDRYLEAWIFVYSRVTVTFVKSIPGSNHGAKDAYARASMAILEYPFDEYWYEYKGYIYNGASSYSGVKWKSETHAIK